MLRRRTFRPVQFLGLYISQMGLLLNQLGLNQMGLRLDLMGLNQLGLCLLQVMCLAITRVPPGEPPAMQLELSLRRPFMPKQPVRGMRELIHRI